MDPLNLAFLKCPLVLILISLGSGCANSTLWQHVEKSRYAMDDEVYAEKYANGAKKGDLLGKAKQLLDARHAKGLGGYYKGAGTQWWGEDFSTFFGGAEFGYEKFPASWASYRGGVAGYIGHGDWFAGLDGGVRIQLPSRISPFAGLGTFHGLSTTYVEAGDDGKDNDDDGRIDETGEERLAADGWLSSIYPEIGVHFWANGHTRLTAHGRYLISSEGRDQDDWFYGIQFAIFHRPNGNNDK